MTTPSTSPSLVGYCLYRCVICVMEGMVQKEDIAFIRMATVPSDAAWEASVARYFCLSWQNYPRQDVLDLLNFLKLNEKIKRCQDCDVEILKGGFFWQGLGSGTVHVSSAWKAYQERQRAAA